MVFKPGISGNPLGRPENRGADPDFLQSFYKQHQQAIKKVGEIALKKAVKDKEPWAIKLCMEYFYRKPGMAMALTKEQGSAVNLSLTSFTQTVSLEDQQAFLRQWMESKRGIPAFSSAVETADIPLEVSVFREDDKSLLEG
jgi:hypothetical protein